MLVIGLGNPGDEYADTPHNLGFMAVDELARRGRLSRWRRVCGCLAGKIRHAGCRFVLAKPQTFMNLSGRVVDCLLRETGTEPAGLVIICDDVHLPFGLLRLRPRGGSGGHKGLEDIISHIDEGFGRMRIGCGPAPSGMDLADFVLSPFPEDHRKELSGIIDRVVEGLILLTRAGWQKAMALVNARSHTVNGSPESNSDE